MCFLFLLGAFASVDPSEESRDWGAGDAAGLQVGSEAMGAVRSRPTRARRSPELLQMPPTMRGGDRAWQERMPLDNLLEVDAESGEDEAVARGKKVRGCGKIFDDCFRNFYENLTWRARRLEVVRYGV